MYKDLISYQLADGVSETQLLKIAQQIVTNWMKDLPGFISWKIHRKGDGSYIDIVSWQTEQDAKNAEKEMPNMPNGAEWFSCYKLGSISSKNVIEIAAF